MSNMSGSPQPITGATKLFPIIGHPVAGVFSPPAFNALFSHRQIDAVMVGLDIHPEALAAFWVLLRGSSNMLGCSITYPHKQAAFQAVDGMSERAARLGALNTIRRDADGRLTGDATDGLAMISAIDLAGVAISGQTAHVTGAGGGAGLAIVDALCEHGIAALSLTEIDPMRKEAVLTLVRTYWPEVQVREGPEPANLLINATTLGKSASDPLPFAADAIQKAMLCCDVVTSPDGTPFLGAAKDAEVATVSGDDMGAGQLAVQLGFLGLL